MNKFVFSTVVLAAVLAVPAHADGPRPVDERRKLAANAAVIVSNVAGSIEVGVWERNELHLTGELAEEVEELRITGNESRLRIEVKLPQRARLTGDTRLVLRVPAGISLQAEAVSADIRVEGLRGNVMAESVSGDVQLDVASREVRAASVSGDVTLQAPARETRVETVSGDVSIAGVKDQVRAESVSGQLEVQAREIRRLDVESVSGDLELDLELAAGAEVEIETLSGEVTVGLPAVPAALDVDLETFSGSLSSNLLEGVRGKEFSRDGDGKGRLRVHSFSGDIDLRKK